MANGPAETLSFETCLASLKTPEIHGWNMWSKQANGKVHVVPEGIAFTSLDISPAAVGTASGLAVALGPLVALGGFLAALKSAKPSRLDFDLPRCEGFHDDVSRVIAIRQDGGRWLVLGPHIRHWFFSAVSPMPKEAYERILSSLKSRMGEQLRPKQLVNRGRFVKEVCLLYGLSFAVIAFLAWVPSFFWTPSP